MLCAISGEAPQVPVVSRKSGNLFEKRLIEAHIQEHHTDPVTGEDLEQEDLLELKSSRSLRPRPPTLTSIPSLLSAFQNEWDAIALETYNLQKELSQTRQELSTALYQHDAATRVIARLVKERDEARDALSNVTISAGGGSNGDAMQVDSQTQPLPEGLASLVLSDRDELSGQRKQRTVPENWASSDDVQSLDSTQTTDPLYPGSLSFALNIPHGLGKPANPDEPSGPQKLGDSETSGDLVLVGGTDGVAGIYSVSKQEIVQTLDVGGRVTASIWWMSQNGELRPVIGSSNGSIKAFENGNELIRLDSHAGAVTSLALHPRMRLLASTGIDKSVVFYETGDTLKIASRVNLASEIMCGAFQPDGHLFGVGCRDGSIRFVGVASGVVEAEVKADGPVRALVFSENGYWLATASANDTNVTIWDLRKLQSSTPPKVLDVGSPIEDLSWDKTGQYLAVAGPGCVVVKQYSKKSWSEPFRKAVPAKGIRWGPNAKSLVTLTADDRLNFFGIS